MNNTLRNKLLKIIGYCLVIGVVAYFFLQHYPEIIHLFQDLKLRYLFPISLLHIPIIALGGVAFIILSQLYHLSIRHTETIGLSFIANLINQILPYRPGMGFRFLYLNQKYHMKLSDFLNVMGQIFFYTLAVSVAFAILGWWLGDLKVININDIMLLGVVLLFLSISFLLIKNSKNRRSLTFFPNSKLIDPFKAFITGFCLPRCFTKSILTFLMLHLLIACTLYLIFLSLNHPIPLPPALFFAGVLSLSSLVPITPGNIGVTESILGALTQLLYHDFSLGFSVSFLFRVSQWIPGILFGLSFSFYLLGRLPTKDEKIII